MAMERRAFILAALATAAGSQGATARDRYRVIDVDVRVSNIVASRIRTDLPGRIAAILQQRGGGRGAPVRVLVELRTIDPYRHARPNERRGLAVRYRVVDAGSGRLIKASRFIERSTSREDLQGTIAFATRPITQGTQERELARDTAYQIIREAL